MAVFRSHGYGIVSLLLSTCLFLHLCNAIAVNTTSLNRGMTDPVLIPGTDVEIQISYYILKLLNPDAIGNVFSQAYKELDQHAQTDYVPLGRRWWDSGKVYLYFDAKSANAIDYHTASAGLQIFEDNLDKIGFSCQETALLRRGTDLIASFATGKTGHGVHADGSNILDEIATA